MPKIVWTIKPTFSSLLARRWRENWERYIDVTSLFISVFIFGLFLWREYYYLEQQNDILISVLPPAIPAKFFWLFIFISCYVIYRFNRLFNRQGINAQDAILKVDSHLSSEMWVLLEQSFRYANKFSHHEVTEIHLLSAALKTNTGQAIFSRLGVDPDKLFSTMSNALARVAKGGPPQLSGSAQAVFIKAAELAVERRSKYIEVGELIMALAAGESLAREVLDELAIETKMVENITIWFAIRRKLRSDMARRARKASWRPKHSLDRAYLAVSTPLLDQISRDLTYMATRGYLKPCVGRDKEIQEVFRLIEGGRSSVVLVGEPGVGKTTIVEGIAQAMVAEEVPGPLIDKKLIALSVPALIGGGNSGEVESRLLQVMNEIVRAGNIILFIDDVHNLSGQSTGGKENLDVGEMVANFITQSRIITLTTTTPRDWRDYVDGTSLGNALDKVKISEPSDDMAIQILEATVPALEYQHHVYFSYGSLAKAVELSRRYVADRFLPEKAIKLCEEVSVFARQHKGDNSTVTADDMAQVIASKVNVPVTQVTKTEGERLINLETILHQMIVGQDEAVKMVAAALRRARVDLKARNKPISTFLFLGPTGVGKTELAKTVAAEYFGGEDKMIRLDMSEYQTAESMYRLIGAPPGLGKEQGFLTEAVRLSPYGLILLDEFEKSHPDILNVFLQLFDDGRLTDSTGRTVDFTNTIIIATSNAGTQFIQESLKAGQPLNTIRQSLLQGELKSYFKPELINRFDGVIVFTPLSLPEVIQITRLLLNKLAKTLQTKGVIFKATDQAVEELARVGFDPLYGARPLQRTIQDRVDNALANYLLTGKLGRRDEVFLEQGGIIRVEKASKL